MEEPAEKALYRKGVSLLTPLFHKLESKDRLFKEEEMKIIKISEVPKEYSTGPIIMRQTLFPDSKEYTMKNVKFGKGMRNKFHTHSNEQILIVTAGRGIVATEREERVVTEGDVVLIPAGEKHWHGATEESEFSHIFLQRIGSVLTKLED